MRLRCHLLGCYPTVETNFYCRRCGAHEHDDGVTVVIYEGRLQALIDAWAELRAALSADCDKCGCRIPLRRWRDRLCWPGFCSESCRTEWRPF